MLKKTILVFTEESFFDEAAKLKSNLKNPSPYEALFQYLKNTSDAVYFKMFARFQEIGQSSLLTPVLFRAYHNDVYLEEIANKCTLSKENYELIFERVEPYFCEQGITLKKAEFPHFQIINDGLSLPKEKLYEQIGKGLSSYLMSGESLPIWYKRFCDLQIILDSLTQIGTKNEASLRFNALWSWAKSEEGPPPLKPKKVTLYSNDASLNKLEGKLFTKALPLSKLKNSKERLKHNSIIFLSAPSETVDEIKSLKLARCRFIVYAANGIWQFK